MKKPVYYVILALLVGVFLFAAYKVGSYYLEKYRSDKVISEANRFVTLPGDSDNNDPTQDPSGDPECPTVQFDELLKTNGDVIAWIYGANTHINYPVVILSCAFSLTMGCCAWFFGPQLLQIYTESSAVISCGVEILSFTTVTYFLCGIMDLIPGALRGMGRSVVPMILSIIGTVGTRIVWIFWIFPYHRSLDILFLSYPVSWILTILMQVICFFIVRKSVHADMKTL